MRGTVFDCMQSGPWMDFCELWCSLLSICYENDVSEANGRWPPIARASWHWNSSRVAANDLSIKIILPPILLSLLSLIFMPRPHLSLTNLSTQNRTIASLLYYELISYYSKPINVYSSVFSTYDTLWAMYSSVIWLFISLKVKKKHFIKFLFWSVY